MCFISMSASTVKAYFPSSPGREDQLAQLESEGRARPSRLPVAHAGTRLAGRSKPPGDAARCFYETSNLVLH